MAHPGLMIIMGKGKSGGSSSSTGDDSGSQDDAEKSSDEELAQQLEDALKSTDGHQLLSLIRQVCLEEYKEHEEAQGEEVPDEGDEG